MKLNILVNGKIGTINLTHSTFIVEDLKAHICKKMGLDVNSYKMKIDFSFNHIELIQTKGNPSFSSNQVRGVFTDEEIITELWKTVNRHTGDEKDLKLIFSQKTKRLDKILSDLLSFKLIEKKDNEYYAIWDLYYTLKLYITEMKRKTKGGL